MTPTHDDIHCVENMIISGQFTSDLNLQENDAQEYGLRLTVAKDAFKIAANVPNARVQSEGSYLEIRDNFGGTREAGVRSPPDAHITSREQRNDSSGSITTVKYTISARAGFDNFSYVIASDD
jgi:hypothetical protein